MVSLPCFSRCFYSRFSFEQTKQEEERRARGDITPSQYQPDLSVRRGEAQSSTAAAAAGTPMVSGGASGRIAASTGVTPTGTPAQTAVTPMNTPKMMPSGGMRPSPVSGRPGTLSSPVLLLIFFHMMRNDNCKGCSVSLALGQFPDQS